MAYKAADIPLLVFIDGYDELQMDVENLTNLPKILGRSEYPNAKLIVTSRPNTIDKEKLEERFSFNNKLESYHFLPFNIDQLLGYLKEQLAWEEETKANYKRTLQSSKSLREVLRNPFVLYLLKESWATLSQEPINQLTRWKIYEGFVRHCITIPSSLFSPQLQNVLIDGYLGLVHSFQTFAKDIAFRACQNKSLTFNSKEAATKLNYPWINLKQLVEEDSQKKFAKCGEELTNAIEKEQRRTILSEDFIV